MTKIYTATVEIEHCGECPHVEEAKKGYKCLRKRKLIPDIWGEIPEWCPLEDK